MKNPHIVKGKEASFICLERMTDKGVRKWGDLGALKTPAKIDKVPELTVSTKEN